MGGMGRPRSQIKKDKNKQRQETKKINREIRLKKNRKKWADNEKYQTKQLDRMVKLQRHVGYTANIEEGVKHKEQSKRDRQAMYKANKIDARRKNFKR